MWEFLGPVSAPVGRQSPGPPIDLPLTAAVGPDAARESLSDLQPLLLGETHSNRGQKRALRGGSQISD